MKIRYGEYVGLCGMQCEVVKSNLDEALIKLKENMDSLVINHADIHNGLNDIDVIKYFDIKDIIDEYIINGHSVTYDMVTDTILSFLSYIEEGALIKYTYDVIPNSFLLEVDDIYLDRVNHIRKNLTRMKDTTTELIKLKVKTINGESNE